MITIVNYDMGNLGSIQNMLKKIGVQSIVTSSPDVISQATKLLLPGVGNFGRAMENLKQYDLIDILNHKVLVEKTPILGICLGMQLMTDYSEEGECIGLGWIKAKTVKFTAFEKTGLKVPHMGWNEVSFCNNHFLSNELIEPRFYFVHTYKVICESEDSVLCTTNYGGVFHSGIQNENVFGVQFHPEKSHAFGMKLLENFCLKV
jgi:glutamine amidotransferase